MLLRESHRERVARHFCPEAGVNKTIRVIA